MQETIGILCLDALRTVRTLCAGFANLLQLFEQRCTIYPNDINIEKLPENTLSVGKVSNLSIYCTKLAFCTVFFEIRRNYMWYLSLFADTCVVSMKLL